MSCQTIRFLGAPSSRHVIHKFNGKLNEKKVTENEFKADCVQITFPKEIRTLSTPHLDLHNWSQDIWFVRVKQAIAVADQNYPDEKEGGVCQRIILPNFCQKLHEIERNWTEGAPLWIRH